MRKTIYRSLDNKFCSATIVDNKLESVKVFQPDSYSIWKFELSSLQEWKAFIEAINSMDDKISVELGEIVDV